MPEVERQGEVHSSEKDSQIIIIWLCLCLSWWGLGGARRTPRVAMEKLAQAGEGEGCMPITFHSIYHHVQSCGVYTLQLRGKILYTTPISTLILICTLYVYMWLGTLCTCGAHPQGADPPPTPLPLRVAKAGRNNLNNEITPLLLPTGIGERYSQTISCADVNSPVNESGKLTQGPSIVSSLLWALTYVHCYVQLSEPVGNLVLPLCGLYTTEPEFLNW